MDSRIGALICLLSTLLAGCGGGGGSSGASSTVASSAASVTSAIGSGSSSAGGTAGNATATAPGAVTITSLVPASGQVTLAWSLGTGASRYAVSFLRPPASAYVPYTANGISPTTVGSLNNGFAYSFAVTPSNAGATGAAATAGPVVPLYAPTLAYQCLRNFHVATNGNDANSGLSASAAYATISAAVSRSDLGAGDCIDVEPGTYDEAVLLARGGSNASATGYVVLRSVTPLTARIRTPPGDLSAVTLRANFLIVDGFDVLGSGVGSGIDSCQGDGQGNPVGFHHLGVLRNLTHDNGGGGIELCWGDYYRVEANISRNNAGTSPYQESGISLYESRAIADAASGFHNVVRNNLSYGNQVRIACPAGNTACHTDGNGIIIDDFYNTQAPAPWTNVAYPYATLVENNLTFGNGASGITVYVSGLVTVRNNTVWHNLQDPLLGGTWRGELSNTDASNNLWCNNLAVTDPTLNPDNSAIQDGYAALAGSPQLAANTAVTWSFNLLGDGGANTNLVRIDASPSTVSTAAGNLLGAAPGLAHPSTDDRIADFSLLPGSAAIGKGASNAPADDLNGRARAGAAAAIGAYAASP